VLAFARGNETFRVKVRIGVAQFVRELPRDIVRCRLEAPFPHPADYIRHKLKVTVLHEWRS
jgi:hypothetical protein